MMYFIFGTLPRLINSYLLGPLMVFVFGATSFILPSAVREHFSGSPQRILSFLFLIILLNGTFKFLARFFNISFIQRITEWITPKWELFKNKLCEFWFVASFRETGYERGKEDGYNGRPHRVNVEMSAKEEASGIAGKCWRFILYLLYIFITLEIILAVIIEMR